MSDSSFFAGILEVGLYSLWLIPVFGIYAYFRIFVDRYAILLKNAQTAFGLRMNDEQDLRRTKENLSYLAKNDDEKEKISEEHVDLRNMAPQERIIYCLEKGLILNLQVPVNEVKTGQITGNDVVSSGGEVLLARGSYLTKDSITQLQNFGVSHVSVMYHPDHPTAKRMMKV